MSEYVFDVNDCSDTALRVAATFETIVGRLRAEQAHHEAEAARITREYLDVDASEDYSIDMDAEESYHRGRAEALDDVIKLLHGEDVTLHGDTEVPA